MANNDVIWEISDNRKNRHNMRWKIPDRRICLNLIGAIILLGGLASAILIYRTAESDSNDVLGYVAGDGSVYPVTPEDSKKYLRDMELYGGKANVLADEFRRSFVGLWHGKSLAFTVACITLLISFGVFYAAHHTPSSLESDTRSENNQDKPT
jgi:hypothetical protein